MKNEDVTEKVSTLTTIPKRQLNKLNNITEYVISDVIEEMILKQEKERDLNLGFGTLGIRIDDTQVRFRFKPSAKLEESVKNVMKGEKNALTVQLETALVEKLTSTYKDLL